MAGAPPPLAARRELKSAVVGVLVKHGDTARAQRIGNLPDQRGRGRYETRDPATPGGVEASHSQEFIHQVHVAEADIRESTIGAGLGGDFQEAARAFGRENFPFGANDLGEIQRGESGSGTYIDHFVAAHNANCQMIENQGFQ